MDKKKLTFAILVSVVIGLAMFLYSDKMELNDFIIVIVGSAGYLGFVYKWLTDKEKGDVIERETGQSFSQYKKSHKE